MDLYSKENINPLIGGPFGLVIGWAPLGGVRSDIPVMVSVTFDSYKETFQRSKNLG